MSSTSPADHRLVRFSSGFGGQSLIFLYFLVFSYQNLRHGSGLQANSLRIQSKKRKLFLEGEAKRFPLPPRKVSLPNVRLGQTSYLSSFIHYSIALLSFSSLFFLLTAPNYCIFQMIHSQAPGQVFLKNQEAIMFVGNRFLDVYHHAKEENSSTGLLTDILQCKEIVSRVFAEQLSDRSQTIFDASLHRNALMQQESEFLLLFL